VLVTPFIARTPFPLFRRRFTLVMCAAGGVALTIIASAKLFPGAYLLVLGPKYGNLTSQVQLTLVQDGIFGELSG